MAERFEKTYISAQEFISSWQKEVYELSFLDYFTFILINNLGLRVEHEYFSNQNKNPYLRIEPDDIATLSFNLGDSFESFLESNCLGDCSMSCPTRLNENCNTEETEIYSRHFQLLQIISGKDLNKRQFFLNDIHNYVVLDTLFDFYNYEIGLNLTDADAGLLQFADFITNAIEKFIEVKGHPFLELPKESASDLFENLIHDTDDDWDEDTQPAFEEENDESEGWKYECSSVAVMVNEFLEQYDRKDPALKKSEPVLQYLKTYADTYAGIIQMEEFAQEDIEEFFAFWLIRELMLETQISPNEIWQVYDTFFDWLDLSKDFDLKQYFDAFFKRNQYLFEDAIAVTRKYFEHNSLVEGILEANAAETQIIDGFFQVEKVSKNGFLRLQDVHFKKDYLNVQINLPDNWHRLEGFILDASLKPTAYGWRIVHLEYIFPPVSRPYLH